MARIKAPAATVTAAIAVLLEGAEYLVRFVGLVVAFVVGSHQAALPVLVPVAVIPLALYAVTAFLVKRGTRWAPLPVTLLSLWSSTSVLYYQDVLAWFTVAIAVIAIVAIWLPSARKFARDATALRGASGVETDKQA